MPIEAKQKAIIIAKIIKLMIDVIRTPIGFQYSDNPIITKSNPINIRFTLTMFL
jgi:hypothetical protein